MKRHDASSLIPANPFDRRAREDPYPVYQFMRMVDPVHRTPAGLWVVTRYADCRAVLEGDQWSHDANRILEPGRAELDPIDPTVRLLRASLMFADPPDHGAHRLLLEKALKPAMVQVDARAARTAAGLIKLMLEKPAVDLVHDYAMPLALVVLCDLIGISAGDRTLVRAWSRELSRGVDPTVRPVAVAKAASAATGIVEYLLDRLDEGANEGLLALLHGKRGDRRTWEVIANVTAFLVMGIEASSALIGNGLLALLRNPGQLGMLRAHPKNIEAAIEELIRYDGPVHLTARVATEEVAVGGKTIPAGEQVIVLLAAANRDPAVFPDPDQLDLARQPNEHMGFGLGVHACFAAPLARRLAKSAISAVVEGVPELTLAGEPEWSGSVTLRSLERLPAETG